jgi:hypothetical protein
MDNPANVEKARSVAIVAVFSAMIVASDYALAGIPNVKLLDTLVFVAAYLFGFRVGAAVGILSETIWSVASPWGEAGAITPFLVGGEVLFAVAGWAAARMWGDKMGVFAPNAVYLGGLLAICAFAWDFETNAASQLFGVAPNLLTAELQGAYFAIPHEVSDFLFGFVVAPVAILRLPTILGLKR